MKKNLPNSFEDFIKDKANQYMVYPSDKVWTNIDKKIRPKNYLATFFISLFMISISGSLVVLNTKQEKIVQAKPGQVAYTFIEKEPIKNKYKEIREISIVESSIIKPKSTQFTKLNPQQTNNISNEAKDNQSFLETFSGTDKIELEERVTKMLDARPSNLIEKISPDKKNIFNATLESVIAKAKVISKNAKWQFYITPSISYRRLEGKASSTIYQYSSFPYSTNSLFARDVNDAVRQSPDIGFEFGASMRYPISNKLTLKTGLQFNYNHYQIEAYSGVPVMATYGMNNYGFGGGTPINSVSIYSNTEGYRKASLKNEHTMLSIPIGIDYVVAGNKNLNFSIGSTIQPSYLIGNNAYLISTNLKNYAKQPNLNRRWNINTAVEANINFQSGSYRWSIGPQYRYQLMSSFKDKYPIKENLFDLGIKLGLIKTIR
jgi:hypothetical protein